MKEIKMEVAFTDGYEQRFTEACLKQMGTGSIDGASGKNEGDQDGDQKKKSA